LYTIIISTTFYLILVALLVASEFGGLNRVWRKLLKKG
jgi:hypothetical protein